MKLFKAIVFKSILAAVMATGFITSGNCFAAAEPAKQSLSAEEREYIHKLIKEIEDVFYFFQDEIFLFVDLKDKTPYRKYVGDLCARIDLFIKETLKPLEDKLEVLEERKNNIDVKGSNKKEYNNIELKDNNKQLKGNFTKNDPYYQGLKIVDELLTEFLGKLHNMRLVLVKYVSTTDERQALPLASELKPHIEALIASEVWNLLKKKLQDVETLMQNIEEHDIMVKLVSLKKVLEASQKGSASLNIKPTDLLACISKKLRCNK